MILLYFTAVLPGNITCFMKKKTCLRSDATVSAVISVCVGGGRGYILILADTIVCVTCNSLDLLQLNYSL